MAWRRVAKRKPAKPVSVLEAVNAAYDKASEPDAVRVTLTEKGAAATEYVPDLRPSLYGDVVKTDWLAVACIMIVVLLAGWGLGVLIHLVTQ
jgi:hypothetical protein